MEFIRINKCIVGIGKLTKKYDLAIRVENTILYNMTLHDEDFVYIGRGKIVSNTDKREGPIQNDNNEYHFFQKKSVNKKKYIYT